MLVWAHKWWKRNLTRMKVYARESRITLPLPIRRVASEWLVVVDELAVTKIGRTVKTCHQEWPISSTFTLVCSWVSIFARQSMYIDNLVRDPKSSPVRQHIDCLCSERPSTPCRHPSYLRKCESKVSYHTTFRPHIFEGRWPWGRAANGHEQKEDSTYRQKILTR
jgi:hypothetical protein